MRQRVDVVRFEWALLVWRSGVTGDGGQAALEV